MHRIATLDFIEVTKELLVFRVKHEQFVRLGDDAGEVLPNVP
jgi:hypothetical protein